MQAATPARAREFDFTDRDFERARRLIHEHAGISLSPAKRDLVYSRLVRRLRAHDLASFDAYLDRVEQGDGQEWQAFTNALTTNLTAFFRETHHFPLLAAHLLRSGAPRSQTVWCTASSTGEEAYSIAMTAVEAFGSFTPPVRILATDVDTGVLETAREGVYPAYRVEQLDPARLRRFFLRGSGARAGQVRVREDLRSLVGFRRVNLLEQSWPVRGPLDAVFCRNVMIYFDKPTHLGVVERFAPLLAADGLLFAGHSESLHHAAHVFRLRGKTVYGLAARGGAA